MKVLAISNNLQVGQSLNSNSKIITFRHSRDAFGFNYSANPTFYQQFRIEAIFKRVKNRPVTEQVYRRQDGVFVAQNVSIDKTYTLETGYLDENSHDALAVALKHSSMKLDDTAYFHQGTYDYDGDDDDTLTNLIQAKATLTQQGYNKTTVTC